MNPNYKIIFLKNSIYHSFAKGNENKKHQIPAFAIITFIRILYSEVSKNYMINAKPDKIQRDFV